MTAEILYVHTLPYIYFFSNLTLKILMDPDQAHRKLVKAAYDAAKAKSEANKQRMKQFHTEVRIGEQSLHSVFIIYEGN